MLLCTYYISNTKYLKELPYYKELIRKYKFIKILINASCIISIIVSFILIARPLKIETSDKLQQNRDIFLCLDVSGSMTKVDKELVVKLKKIVSGLKDDRVGIVIFDNSPVVLMPLTDDYEYVNTVLEILEKSFDGNFNYSLNSNESDEEEYMKQYISGYIYEGTREGEGSSLIGTGLAACLSSFSNTEEQRTRIVLFATDNQVMGTEIISIEDAVSLAKEKRISVYGLEPRRVNEEEKFNSLLQLTGGSLYKAEDVSAVDSIVDKIEKTEKNKLEGQKQTTKIDKPQIFFIILLFTIIIIFVLNKKVNI